MMDGLDVCFRVSVRVEKKHIFKKKRRLVISKGGERNDRRFKGIKQLCGKYHIPREIRMLRLYHKKN